MFPFTITYTKPIDSVTEQDRQQIMDELACLIQSNNAKVTSSDKTQLFFTVNWFGFTWEKFSLIDKGKFTLTNENFKFTFSMYRLFIVTIAMSFYMWYLSSELWLGIFFFVGLGLGNWITALVKYNHMTSDIAATLNKKAFEKQDFA